MRNFILAARPKTLLAGGIPPIVAYTYFYGRTGENQAFYLTLCILGALFIQIATNFFNDVIDHEKGADKKRVGPTRVSASGLVKVETVRIWAYLCVGLGALCGLPLILRGGWPFLVLGLISLYLTYGYTGGKVSLAYRGLGELFVFLFFGLFSVMGSYYLFALHLDFHVFILASIFGLLATTFICVNNLRDRETDQDVGKMTLATKLSPNAYKGLILLTILLPYLLLHFYRDLPYIHVVFLALIPAIKLSSIVMKKQGQELNEGLKFSGIHLTLFSLLLGLTFTYARLLPGI
ncbi:MAG TPA: 1,4-dihydroxy-2-naphthoate octaprenyltransferase [Bacteriovoracaceae bacterium]|nr:1,4-dihydroxy-2-naphthoate octaprenyltransferase [Bacteriovoracaceae bacterium]